MRQKSHIYSTSYNAGSVSRPSINFLFLINLFPCLFVYRIGKILMEPQEGVGETATERLMLRSTQLRHSAAE